MSIAPEANRWRSRHDRDIEFKAEYMAQTRGGEIEFWVEKLAPVDTPFNDKFLIKKGFELIKAYDFMTPESHVLYQVCRYHHRYVKRVKAFVQRHRDPDNGEWLFGAGPIKIPYRWPDLVARPDDTVYFTEGEKDADRLVLLGLLATTVAGQNWSSTAAEALAGRDVCILEDNDQAGRDNTAASVAALQEVAKSVCVVKLPGLERGQDVSDWLDAGHTKDELTAIVDAAPRFSAAIPLFNVARLDGVPVPQQEWSVPDRIPAGHTTLLSGEGAVGKSIVMLQLCIAAVLYRDWLGVTPRQGSALFVDAEDDENVIHKRLYDVLGYYGANFAAMKDKLHVASLIGHDAIIGAFNRRSSRVEPTLLYHKLHEMVGDLKPTIIGLASSANVFAGNEIDRSQVQQFISLLTRLARLASGSLILISHPSVQGISSDSGISGSTQWHNSVRARMFMKGLGSQEGEPKGHRRGIEFRKNNYGPISENIVVEYKNGLFVPISDTDVDQAERHQKAEEVYLAVLNILAGQNQDLAASKNSRNYVVAAIADHPSARRFTKKDMEAAQQRLLDASKIHIEEVGPPSKRSKRVVPGPGTIPEM